MQFQNCGMAFIGTKSKRNLTFAIKILRCKYRVFAILDRKIRKQFAKKRPTFVRNATSAMLLNEKIKAQRKFRKCGGCKSCALPTSTYGMIKHC